MKSSILIVEDEVLIREMLKEIFLPEFGEVYTADNGESGLRQYMKHKPSLVITDIKMKKMDGLTMIERIQEINLDQRFIVITAYSDEDHLLRVNELKISHYLIKPIDCRVLLEMSRELVQHA